ncbi:MAG: DNA/RNA non-specific endonuclease [Sphaerochaetaceae bacterium]|jgi:endonuclease G
MDNEKPKTTKKRKTRMERNIKKAKKRGKRLLILLAVLLVIFVVTMLLTPSEETYYAAAGTSESIPNLELPASRPGDQIIRHEGYTLCYNEEHEQPDWVAYELTREEVYGSEERKDNFRPDPQVATGSATLDDYRGSGYDRGHLIPAADLKWSAEAMSDSFYLSNMSPQDPQFNRGIWGTLEGVVRNFAATEESVYVVTGPVLTDGPYKTIGKNKVSVPKRYYKVVLDYREPEIKAIGFLLPNEGSKKSVQSFAVSVADVEAATGLDFFPLLPDDIEARLERSFDTSAWDFSEFRASAEERANIESAQKPKASGTIGTLHRLSGSFLVKIKKELIGIIEIFIPKSVTQAIGL